MTGTARAAILLLALSAATNASAQDLPSALRVHDACSVAPDVQPIFQLQVPTQPVLQPDGSLHAGVLRIVSLQPVTVNIVSLASSEFSQGYRIEFTGNAGCTFDVELQTP